VKAKSGGIFAPGTELGSVQQDARTCPVCGAKFFATADSGFCPICILRGLTIAGNLQRPEKPASQSRSADRPGETEGGSQPRRLENYDVILNDGKPIERTMGFTSSAVTI
jgi:hypothetical protein